MVFIRSHSENRMELGNDTNRETSGQRNSLPNDPCEPQRNWFCSHTAKDQQNQEYRAVLEKRETQVEIWIQFLNRK